VEVRLYDTTLRDGAQGEGISFSLEAKLRICERLARFGARYIEGGWPGANPKDTEFFARARELELGDAALVAFGSTRRAGVSPEEDGNLRALLSAGTPAVALVGKAWTLHVEEILRTTRAENLRMIADSVGLMVAHGVEVFFDAEHFFDGFKEDRDYALEVLRAAAEAGADWLVLCDTNGGTLPWEVGEITAAVRREFPGARLGIHAHDDGGLAVANTLAAVRAGAELVEVTVNGYGERCGNADLCVVVPDLQLKMGYEVVPPERLRELTSLSHFVAELANMPQASFQPYVGRSAFAHNGGIHVDAFRKVPRSYQHIDPGLVGNRPRVLVSELSGKANVEVKAAELGFSLSGEEARRVVRAVKELEGKGFQFEGAEGSFELLVRRSLAARLRPALRTPGFPGAGGEARGQGDPRRGHGEGTGGGGGDAHRGGGERPRPRPGSGDPEGTPPLLPGTRAGTAFGLQGADPERGSWDRGHGAGPDPCLRWRALVGHGGELSQHHRGQLAGAGR